MRACTGSVLASSATLWLWLARAAAAAAEPLVDDAAFAADDECLAAPGSERCGLNALQLKRSRLGGPPPPAPSDEEDENDESVAEAACEDAQQGGKCFQEIQWAMTTGIQQHPEWYPGMTADMLPVDFQWIIHAATPGKCPKPCSGTKREPPPPAPAPPPTKPPMPVPPADPSACLCVFDIDRTLTAKQGSSAGECPATKTAPGVEDNAYGGGELALSELSLALEKTFCSKCFLGFCSHGNADAQYSKERDVLLHKVVRSEPMKHFAIKPENAQWSDEELLSPYVVYSPDGVKQLYVARIREFYQRQGVNILPEHTYFFDDRANNVLPFAGTGMNARQISCETRDMDIGEGAVGLCGATVAEIVREPGVVACPGFEAKVAAEEAAEEDDAETTDSEADDAEADVEADVEAEDDAETKDSDADDAEEEAESKAKVEAEARQLAQKRSGTLAALEESNRGA